MIEQANGSLIWLHVCNLGCYAMLCVAISQIVTLLELMLKTKELGLFMNQPVPEGNPFNENNRDNASEIRNTKLKKIEKIISTIYVAAAVLCILLIPFGQVVLIIMKKKLEPNFTDHTDLINKMNSLNGTIFSFFVFLISIVLMSALVALVSMICKHFGGLLMDEIKWLCAVQVFF